MAEKKSALLTHDTLQIREHVALAAWSNYKIGGEARYFCEPRSVDALREVLMWAKERGLPFFILGGGTNVLIRDEGFAGLVVKPHLAFMEASGADVRAGTSVPMPDLLDFCAARGLAGLEWAGGLPGTVGGAIRGNAGAFGGEIKDCVRAVEVLDAGAFRIRTRSNAECNFGYRTSVVKERQGQEVILAATLSLRTGEEKAIRRAIEEKIAYRIERHPMEYPNIGSMFKNVPLAGLNAGVDYVRADAVRVAPSGNPPVPAFVAPAKVDPFPVIPAAYLIAEAGLKGMRENGAMVSPKHPNFIVNAGNATARDVRALMQAVQQGVKKQFGIMLHAEVELFPESPHE